MNRPDVLRVYFIPGYGWCWKLSAPNNRIIGGSTEAYARRVDCIANAARVLDLPEIEAGTIIREWSPAMRVVIES